MYVPSNDALEAIRELDAFVDQLEFLGSRIDRDEDAKNGYVQQQLNAMSQTIGTMGSMICKLAIQIDSIQAEVVAVKSRGAVIAPG